MTELMSPIAALWTAVVVSGLYHGVNPGMGWPLAVSAALMERKASALRKALVALACGHLLAMLAILLPFSLLTVLVTYEREIRVAAGLLVVGMGLYLLVTRRHPRFLARVSPAKLGLWSFLAALAHGAALMLVPIYLGICTWAMDEGHQAAETLMGGNIATAVAVALVHTLAMTLAGAALAFGVYRWLGLKALTRTWINLDTAWALSLVIVGAFGIWSAFSGHGSG